MRGSAILAFIYSLAHKLSVIVSISLRTPFKLGVPNVLLTLLGQSGRSLSSLPVSISLSKVSSSVLSSLTELLPGK